MQIPLTRRAVGLDDPGPGRAAEHARPVVRWLLAVRARSVTEDVAVAGRGPGSGGQGLPEPTMLVGGVVGHDVQQDPYTSGVRLRDERIRVVQRAEARLDSAVVDDVVAGI